MFRIDNFPPPPPGPGTNPPARRRGRTPPTEFSIRHPEVTHGLANRPTPITGSPAPAQPNCRRGRTPRDLRPATGILTGLLIGIAVWLALLTITVAASQALTRQDAQKRAYQIAYQNCATTFYLCTGMIERYFDGPFIVQNGNQSQYIALFTFINTLKPWPIVPYFLPGHRTCTYGFGIGNRGKKVGGHRKCHAS